MDLEIAVENVRRERQMNVKIALENTPLEELRKHEFHKIWKCVEFAKMVVEAQHKPRQRSFEITSLRDDVMNALMFDEIEIVKFVDTQSHNHYHEPGIFEMNGVKFGKTTFAFVHTQIVCSH